MARQRFEYPRLADYTNEDGSVRWDELDSHRAEIGAICYSCRQQLIASALSGPTLCGSCKQSDKPGEWDSERRIRCPGCRGLIDPLPFVNEYTQWGQSGTPRSAVSWESPENFGTLSINCSCGTLVTVKVARWFVFTSPSPVGVEYDTEPEGEEAKALHLGKEFLKNEVSSLPAGPSD